MPYNPWPITHGLQPMAYDPWPITHGPSKKKKTGSWQNVALGPKKKQQNADDEQPVQKSVGQKLRTGVNRIGMQIKVRPMAYNPWPPTGSACRSRSEGP